jgi:D-arabinose 5-phosphate isomerase GutQ
MDKKKTTPSAHERSEDGKPAQGADSRGIAGVSDEYVNYLGDVSRSLSGQREQIDDLCSLIQKAGAVHVYGFGRSGTAALAFAIRLRQFRDFLPETWWVGDQVRMPIRENDLLVLFSRDGSRSEVISVAYMAAGIGARIALVTAGSNSRLGALTRLKIIIPPSTLPDVYGGGDFELAAFFFQEVLVTHIGKKLGIPQESVWRNHV